MAVFNSLEDESLEDFTVKLAQSWGIGQKSKNNGVTMALFMKEHRSRIEVGYGLEGALPDALCATILRRELVPRFKQGDFAGGIRAALDAIQQATRGEYRGDDSDADGQTMGKGALILLWVIALALYAVFPAIVYLLTTAGWAALVAINSWSPALWVLVLPFIALMEWFRQRWIVPRLGLTIHSRRCRGSSGYFWRDFGGSGGSGGSLGGFGGGGGFSSGGGSFGGGGASGSW